MAEEEDQSADKALPQNARLVKVGNEYRVLWSLDGPGERGDLGLAWYTISGEDLKRLYGKSPKPMFDLKNEESFKSHFGGKLYFWGDVSEIGLKADTPWDDMKDRVYSAFGHMPGLDDPEIKRILLQAFFEGWSAPEFEGHYKQTKWYGTKTDTQREWLGLSESEQSQRISSTRSTIASLYERWWGVGAKLPSSLNDDARKIASGAMSQETWEFNTRKEAEKSEGSPAANAVTEAIQNRGRSKFDTENIGGELRDMWEMWVGGSPTQAWVNRWQKQVFLKKNSYEDIEKILKKVSQGRWQFKPDENMTYADWAEGYKSQIADQLEMSDVGDNDQLLRRILGKGMQGDDVITAIRGDNRFLETNRYRDETYSAVDEIGKTFGFI